MIRHTLTWSPGYQHVWPVRRHVVRQQPLGLPPAADVALLRTMRRARDPRLNATLRRAQRDGWSLRVLSEALEVKTPSVVGRIARAVGEGVPLSPVPVDHDRLARIDGRLDELRPLYRRLVELRRLRDSALPGEGFGEVEVQREFLALVTWLHDEGASLGKIGSAVGVSRVTVHRWVRQA